MQVGLPWDIVVSLRSSYPKGSKVELISMAEDIHRLPDGLRGRLDHIDDAGQFHINWENGSYRALVLGEDDFRITPVTFKTVKYFFPITVDRYTRKCLGGDLDGPESLYDSEIVDNLFFIDEALEKEQRDYGTQGHWEFYDGEDELKEKVKSLFYTSDIRAHKPWGVAVCVVRDDITVSEENILRDFIEGDLSDGFGEVFEQGAITNDSRDDLYIHLWQTDMWFLKEENELFAQEDD